MPNYRSTPHWRGQSTVISHQYNAPPPLHCHTLHIPMLWIVAEAETLWPLKIQDYIKYWKHLKMSQPSGVTGISWNSISASNWNRHNKFWSDYCILIRWNVCSKCLIKTFFVRFWNAYTCIMVIRGNSGWRGLDVECQSSVTVIPQCPAPAVAVSTRLVLVVRNHIGCKQSAGSEPTMNMVA